MGHHTGFGRGRDYRGPDRGRAWDRQAGRGQFTLGWSGPLRSGVALAQGPELTDADIAMAFYGSLFRKKLSKGGTDPLYTAINIQDEDEVALLQAWSQAVAAPGTGGDVTKARSPGSVQAALRALSKGPFFSGVAEHLMIADLKQVTRYMRDAELRAEIQACVRAAIEPDTRVVLGHSLGSVIAYEVLAASPELNVRTLVTLGSPLGIPKVIFDRLAPPPAGGMGAWPGMCGSGTTSPIRAMLWRWSSGCRPCSASGSATGWSTTASRHMMRSRI